MSHHAQARHFADPQARAVGGHQQDAMAEIGHPIDQSCDLLTTENLRQLAGALRHRDRERARLMAKGGPGEEPQSAHHRAQASPREAALFDEMAHVALHVAIAELVRGATVVPCEIGHDK